LQDGWLYDFDFNQMLDLKVASKSTHISEFVESDLKIEILSFNNIYMVAALVREVAVKVL
jgi:hypothetical protein